MKTIEQFLFYLCSLGIKLWAEGDHLRCNAPKGTLTPILRTQLASRKAEILMFLHKSKLSSHSTLEPILPVPRDKALPLSFAQARLWFLNQLQPNSSSYNIFAAVRLRGSLNVAALEQSINEIVQRHEALRTNFVTVEGQPVQVIAPTLTLALPLVDLRELSEVEQSAEVRRLVTKEQARPFDLSNSFLLRVSLLMLGEEEYILLVTMHHIISDGWSVGIFIQELSTLYEAYLSGQPSPLPQLPIQYADFAFWQRQQLQEEVLETQINYWKQHLAGAPPLLKLPTNRPRPPMQTFRGGSKEFELNADLTRRLKNLSQQSDATLFMTLLAVFVTLLSRYAGQEDIVVGIPIANRNCREIEGLIGFFVNTLVLRTNLKGKPSFEELLQRVQLVALDAYAHQDVPFEQLVEALQPERSLSHSPLFQVMFVLQNAPMKKLELPGLTLTPLELENVTAKFDLTLSMSETKQGLRGSLEYNADIFDAATITQMLRHFQTLVEGIVVNPQQHIQELPLLTASEQHQLLVEWNHTQVDYSKDVCIHKLFEDQVEQTPDAIAVVFEGQQLTYQELNCCANQLAHYLQKIGVALEALVGICLERSVEMVVGLLGILKAGGAYVPLDPAYPQERLTFMLDDSQVLVLLTQEHLVKELPEHRARVICLDTDWAMIANESSHNPDSGTTANNLAYVIYTSGSTGKPKGAMNHHRGVCNRLLWMQDVFQLTEADHVLQKTPFSFDVSVWEFFWPLIVGARLVLAQPGGHQDSAYLIKLIAEKQITTLHFVPSMLQVFLEEQDIEVCNCLRQVMCSGEALPFEVQRHFLARVNAKLHNLYGPTEAAIDVTYWTCKLESERYTVPIGHPIANTQIYLLDTYLQPVPVGVPGELHIGGVGLARGYLHRPEMTAERFIPNPYFTGTPTGYSDKTGTRLYKTGDLARYLSDGTIEFLGRIDHQVKIRGLRIDLGEIEAVLDQHPAVQETVAIVREDVLANKRLVAYVVVNQATASTIPELHHFLKEKLPEYMVPAAIVILEALPLTPNGKVDRHALSAFDMVKPEFEETFVAPRTLIEELLASIWVDVLGLERVGIHDNFFKLGGDSLLSIQIIARANRAGLVLTPNQLFQHQTIAKLASVAGTTPIIQAEQGLVTGTIPLTPIQQWFFEQQLPEPHHWNQAILLEVHQALELELLQQVVQQLLVHHDALRLRFVHSASGIKQVNALPNGMLPVMKVDVSMLADTEQTATMAAVVADQQASLNLESGPLMRVAMFDLGPNKPCRLLLVIHHLAVDGVSWRILLEDLQMAYQQICRGEAIALPPKTTSFQKWAQTLSEYAQSAVLEQELDYWLADPPSFMATLPIDYPEGRHANTVASTRKVSLALNAEQTRALLLEVPQAYNTHINDVLLTALLLAVAQWTGTRYLLVDLEGHGREEISAAVDLTRTVGWFTTVFPVLLELLATTHPGEVLKSVKEQLRRIPNRGIGYGLLRYLKGNAAIAAQLQTRPQAEMSFNYLGQLDQVLSSDSTFALAKESSGPEHSLLGRRSHLLEINALVAGGRLQLDWIYSSNLHQQATIEGLAQSFVEALRTLIAHCQSPLARGYTPSDFPDVKLSQEKLDKVLADIYDDSMENRINKKNIEAIYPLSPSQQGMLFETLSAAESGIHIEQLIVTWHEDLNVAAFEQAWQRVVERHSILRTSFVWKNQDQPLNVVHKQAEVPLVQQDWRGLSSFQQQEQLQAALSADRRRGFNFTRAPLIRLALFQISKNKYQILWTQHHILMDGWCLPLILKEVFALYKALSTGQDLSLPATRPYQDYIVWLKQQDLSQSETFWRKTLRGFTKPTPIGVKAEPRSFSGQEERYGEQQAHLSASATAELQSLVRQHHLTLNNLVQGVWALLLNRYSCEEDVVFGATVSGRPPNLAGVESMIGLFINTLPVRIKVSPNASLWAWLKNIQLQQIEQQAYEYCCAGQVHQWSEVAASLPLYESILVFENYPDNSSIPHSSELTIDISDAFSKGAQTKHALTILVRPSSELMVKIVYDRYRLDTADVTRILEHFLALLKEIDAVPDQHLATLLNKIPSEQIPKVRLLQKRNQHELEETFVAPRDILELQLTQIWKDVLEVDLVGVRDNFFDLGGHSLLAIRLITKIQQQFEKNLSLATLFQSATIEQMARLLRQQKDSLPWSPLVVIQPGGSKRPLFCVHPGGGGVLCYVDLAHYLGSEQPFYGLQALGLEDEQEPLTQVEDMATYYIKAVQAVQPQGPYFLAGWSFGGLVAFEMAQQLQARGQQVSFLGLLDTYAPSVAPRELQDEAALLVNLFAKDISLSLEHLRQFGTDEQLIYVMEQLRSVNLLPPDFGQAQAHRLLQVYKLHRQALQSYVPQHYFGVVTLFQASEEASATSQDQTMGWGDLATEGVEIHRSPGNHETMVRKPHVQVLAKHLRACLEQIQAND